MIIMTKYCSNCGSKLEAGESKTKWTELVKPIVRGEDPDPEVNTSENPNKQVYYYSDKVEVKPVEPTATGKPAKKSKIGWISVALILIFVVAAVWYAMGDHGEDRSIESAREFYVAVMDEAILLEDTGIDIADYWYDALVDGKYGGTKEGALEAALALHQDDIDGVTENFGYINLLYDEAKEAANNAGQYELANAIEEVYDDLFEFCNAVLNYDGEYNDYADAYNASNEALYNSMDVLYNMIV